MTIHFVNLVSLEFFVKSNTENRKLFVDSITLHWALRLLGVKVERQSGVNYYANLSRTENSLLIGNKSHDFMNFIQAPKWRTLDEVNLEFLNNIEVDKYDRIVINISSPKQDRMAMILHERIPGITILCLGAAIDYDKRLLILDKLGLSWLLFAVKNPRRFVIKLGQMLFGLIFIFGHKKAVCSLFETRIS